MRIESCIVLVAAACSDSKMMTGGNVPPSCGNAVVDPGEQCDDGNDNAFDGCRPDCTAVDKLQPTPMAWQYFEIPDTKCIDGTPAGFSVNYNPGSTKLAIYLEGGGACFNSFCESLFTPSAKQPSNGGIFDRTNAANPVKDWTWVYVPYCSGDVYAGKADTMVGGKTRSFYGYTNHEAFLERIVPSFAVDQVLLTGSSAGGFGAAVNFAQTQRAYGDVPVVLVDDSGPPMSADVFPPCLQTLWSTTWGFDKTLLAECGADCSDPSRFVSDTFDHIGKQFPTMHGGLFSSVGDATIRTFAGYGWTGGYNMCGNFPSAVPANVYEAGLDSLRTDAMANHPGFGTFFIAGTTHTILRTSNYGTMMVGTTTVAQWIAALLAGTANQVGP